MEHSARLNLLWSSGFQATSLAFVDDHTLVYGSGNTLTFVRRDGSHVRSAPSLGKGVGCISVCSHSGLLAYSEVTLDPKIFLLSYPDLRMVSTLEGGAKLSYSHLEFSRSGNHLLSVSDEPDFKLTVWQIINGAPVCGTVVGLGVQEVSFNPLNWKQICVVTREAITLWMLEQCGPNSLLTPTTVQTPSVSTPVGKVLPAKTNQLQPLPVDKLALDTSRVLYPQPYVDQLHRPKPVVPLAHCWTPTGGIYCGCEGGQLFLVDSESGSATVLVSPLAAAAVEEVEGAGLVRDVADLLGGDGSVVRCGGVGGEATGMTPVEEEEGSGVDLGPTGQPASSVLRAGDIGCLALNRRGLYAAGKNGVLYCFELTKELVVQDHWSVGEPISSLTWSASYDKLAFCTPQGAIFLTEPFNLSNVQLVVNYGRGSFVGVDFLPTKPNLCVTCRSNGMVQVWGVGDAGLVSTFDLQTQCTSVCVLASCSAVAIGSESGHLQVLSLFRPRRPTLVTRLHLYYCPVAHLAHDKEGQFLAAAGKDSPDVYIMDARPSSNFQVLGRIVVKFPVTHLSLGSADSSSHATPLLAVASGSDGKEGQPLMVCELPSDLPDKMESAYVDSTLLLSDSYINVKRSCMQSEVEAIALLPNKKAIGTLAQSRDLALLCLLKQEGELLEVESTVEGHEMKVNGITTSPNGQLVLSASASGKLQIRKSSDRCLLSEVTAHDVHLGGCTGASFCPDGSSLLSVGDNGLLQCWTLEFDSRSKRLQDTAIEHAENWRQRHATLIQEQNKSLRGMVPLGDVEGYSSDDDDCRVEEAVRGMGDGSCDEVADFQKDHSPKQESVAPSRATSARVSFKASEGDGAGTEDDRIWLEQTKEEIKESEGDEHAELKAELRQELQELRSKVLAMIEANEVREDIEKLGRPEFILDTEEHQRLLAAEDEVLQKEREELELANLAQLYLREVLRTQCWDEMKVKGKVLKAFQTQLEVSNYALQQEDPEETRELETVKQLRQLELAESKARSKFVLTSDQAEDQLDEDDEMAAAPLEPEDGTPDPFALVGSQAAKYGGGSDLLYDQFELFSCERMRHQIVLLKDCIRNIKLTFNKEFDEVLKLKEAEIKRIKERNVRIAKIVSDLKLPDMVVDPYLDSHEDPEQLLIVDPSEVKVEKYISEEEAKRLEEEARLDEEKKAAERADNWRERALDMMMDGRLEINPEEELFKDLPRPECLMKPAEAMTEEELKIAKEFEKREAELLEEREKYKKSLEAELRRLQEANAQGLEGFDARLKKLFHLKIKTEMAVNQEELKALRLGVALMMERELGDKEEELYARLEDSKNKKIALASAITAARQKVEEMQQAYDICLAEDKDLDKGFKKEFADCEPHLDQLYKLYKKRPRGQRLKAMESGMQHDPSSSNPFAHRPMSALGGKKAGGDLMVELDHPSNMPEGLDRHAWDHFVKARRRKVESEQKVKGVALELAEMQAYLDKRIKTDESLQQDIQDTFKELNRLRDERSRSMLNLEVQLLLKQGQVEVETGQFVPNFTDSVLIHRKLIEDLNAEIKDLGKGKLSIMKECKEFKKGIHMLEWEHQKIRMEAEDLLTKTKDIQNLKVTKELQKRLLEEDQVERSHQQENEVLEKTLALNEKMLQKAVKDKQRTLTKLQQEIKEKKKESAALDQELRELQVCILERKEIEDLAGVPPAEANAEAKMHDIVLRRRLVETAKSQAQEVAVLRAELERLRMRTFPALVQVDN